MSEESISATLEVESHSEETRGFIKRVRRITRRKFTPEEEGLMVLELSGEQTDYDKGIKYLIENGVRIQSLSQDFILNEERCTHCGACVTICPTAAFELDPVTRRVNFYGEKCMACGLCIKACPPRAMEVHF